MSTTEQKRQLVTNVGFLASMALAVPSMIVGFVIYSLILGYKMGLEAVLGCWGLGGSDEEEVS